MDLDANRRRLAELRSGDAAREERMTGALLRYWQSKALGLEDRLASLGFPPIVAPPPSADPRAQIAAWRTRYFSALERLAALVDEGSA